MERKKIIGSILIFFALLELIILEIERSSYELGIYGFTVEMFYFFSGIFMFLAIGALILRKRKLIYWSMSWAVTSVIVGILALWTFILSANPTERDWGALAQSAIYYIIGSLQIQTAVLLATLALHTSYELRRKVFSIFTWFSLVFSSAILLLYIGSMVYISICEKSILGIPLYGFLLNTIPLSVTISIILFILKEKRVKNG